MDKSYQELRDRMDQWELLREGCSGAQAVERLKELTAMMRDILDLALSEKKKS